MNRLLSHLHVLLLAAALAFVAGCASSVDNTEIVRSSNPVGDMHKDVLRKVEAEQNRVEWYSYEDALVKARRDNKFVMLEFYTTWCKWCKKFNEETLYDPDVAAMIKTDFVAVKIDAESADRVVHEMRQMAMFELADDYGVQSFPTIWFLEPDGKRAKTLMGYMGAPEFLEYLSYIRNGGYKEAEF